MYSNILDSRLAFVATQAALEAGHLLRRGFGTDFTISSKANILDLVTEYDKAAEELIIKRVKTHFPDHAFLGEESGVTLGKNSNAITWVIDPLDGTMNFAHQIPLFAVSIAIQVNNQVELGIVYHPMGDEFFIAQRGCGAYLNGTRLKVSDITDLQQAVGATLIPYGSGPNREYNIHQFLGFTSIGNPIRIIGSAALALAYVAAGRFDAFWATNLRPWDVAACQLLIEEAGGRITTCAGDIHDIYAESSILATNKHLHEHVLSILK